MRKTVVFRGACCRFMYSNDPLGRKMYCYGFNGKEKDDEVKGLSGSSYDFGARIYDPRLGKFISVDPRYKDYPDLGPYAYAANSPISLIDDNGEGPAGVVRVSPDGNYWQYGYQFGSAYGSNSDGFLVISQIPRTFTGLAVEMIRPMATLHNYGIADGPNSGKINVSVKMPDGEFQGVESINNPSLLDAGIALASTIGEAEMLEGLGSLNVRWGTKSTASETSILKTVPETTAEVNLEARAKELHGRLHPFKQSKTTTAVTEAVDASGNKSYLISSSDYYLPKELRTNLNPNEFPITKFKGHAEVSGIDAAKQMELTPLRVGASRPICLGCQEALKTNNVKAASRIKFDSKNVSQPLGEY